MDSMAMLLLRVECRRQFLLLANNPSSLRMATQIVTGSWAATTGLSLRMDLCLPVEVQQVEMRMFGGRGRREAD